MPPRSDHVGRFRPAVLLSLLVLVLTDSAEFRGRASAADRDLKAFFENSIRPLLIENCVKCHGPKKSESGLRLDSSDAILKGGASGPAVVPLKSSDSLLMTAVRHEDGFEMPPGKKLSRLQIDSLAKWIDQGAIWPDGMTLGKEGSKLRGGAITAAERAHWSYRPLRAPVPPDVDSSRPVRNDIDRFIQAQLIKAGLRSRSPAAKRVLIRRATFDLTGLPPTPKEIEAFLQDSSEDAFARVVDRLLASTAYGERWGRHWLDVVRYADTAGDTADYPTPLSWKYRNWVIDAYNRDMPYDEFVRHQIAGDIFAGQVKDISETEYGEKLAATGFLAISRRFGFDVENYHHLTIQDTIDTLGQAVLGLTVGCARCHDHKYDPINMEDYYGWYGIFESTRYSFPGSEQKKRPYDLFPAVPPDVAEKQKAQFEAQLEKTEALIAQLEAEQKARKERLRAAGGWQAYLQDRRLVKAASNRDGHDGFHVWMNEPLPLVGVSTAQETLKVPGTVVPGKVVVHPNPKEGVGIAWESPISGRIQITGRVADAHNCGDSVQWHLDLLTSTGLQEIVAGTVKTNLDSPIRRARSASETEPAGGLIETGVEKGEILQLAVMPKTHYGCDLTQVDLTISEVGGRRRVWDLAADVKEDLLGGNPNDDQYGGSPWYFYLVAVDRGRSVTFEKPATLSEAELARLPEEIAKASHQIQSLTAKQKQWKESGPYAQIYGANEQERPQDARIHIRGERNKQGKVVPRKNLEILGGQPLENPDRSGRAELAVWLTGKKNSLTPRVIANRIWLHHFGQGLVVTANDFGTRGEKPSHPDLLDWLATRFIRNGWSVKQMHRLIMNSAAYRQSSEFDATAARIDPESRLLWRFSRRRLSAEEIRDAMLAVSGDLDPSRGDSHPFPPVETWSFTQHAPFYGVYPSNRRSVYLMQQRLKRHPFLSLFDGVDVNVSTAKRELTTVPTQALFLMNSEFVHDRAASLTRRIFRKQSGIPGRIRLLYETTLGRPCSAMEQRTAEQFLKTWSRSASPGEPADSREAAAWQGFARTMLTRNEFLFVD